MRFTSLRVKATEILAATAGGEVIAKIHGEVHRSMALRVRDGIASPAKERLLRADGTCGRRADLLEEPIGIEARQSTRSSVCSRGGRSFPALGLDALEMPLVNKEQEPNRFIVLEPTYVGSFMQPSNFDAAVRTPASNM